MHWWYKFPLEPGKTCFSTKRNREFLQISKVGKDQLFLEQKGLQRSAIISSYFSYLSGFWLLQQQINKKRQQFNRRLRGTFLRHRSRRHFDVTFGGRLFARSTEFFFWKPVKWMGKPTENSPFTVSTYGYEAQILETRILGRLMNYVDLVHIEEW